MPSFEFTVVRVNDRGREIDRQRRSAEFFAEDLGNGVILEMVSIPGGSFLMGSPDGEKEREDSEGPQHRVTVPEFFMGKYPLTQAQWRAVAGLPKVNHDLEAEPSKFNGDNLPVENVSWYDAVEFCTRLSNKTGRTYRLPSEAEWEYTCRAGTTTPFHFGETITSQLANYRGTRTYNSEPKGEYREQTTPVGYFQVANNFLQSIRYDNFSYLVQARAYQLMCYVELKDTMEVDILNYANNFIRHLKNNKLLKEDIKTSFITFTRTVHRLINFEPDIKKIEFQLNQENRIIAKSWLLGKINQLKQKIK